MNHRDIDAMLYGADEGLDEPPPTGLDEAAVWARRARAVARDLAVTEAMFAEEMQRLIDQREAVLGPVRERLAYYENGVEQWHRAARAAGSAKPTVTWPCGSRSLVKDPGAAPSDITDEDAMMGWIEEHLGPDDPRRAKVMVEKPATEQFSIRGLKDLGEVTAREPGTPGRLVIDGEEVPGVQWVTPERRFTMTYDTEETR